MPERAALPVSLAAWVAVWAFWLVVTRSAHPTFELAIIVTTSLVVAYAAAAYVHHLVLLPRVRATRKRAVYIASLAGTMVLLTSLALVVIRVSYVRRLGPDPDPYGVYKHFAIDLFGMAVHLLAARAVVALWRTRLVSAAAGNGDRGDVISA